MGVNRMAKILLIHRDGGCEYTMMTETQERRAHPKRIMRTYDPDRRWLLIGTMFMEEGPVLVYVDDDTRWVAEGVRGVP